MPINIIVAFASKSLGIGVNGRLPWDIPEDLARFQQLTKGATVVMGRRTWESIPEDKRPLKDRVNIVVTSTPIPTSGTVKSVRIEELDNVLQEHDNVYVIGGTSLYARYLGRAKRIYATIVDSDATCDTFFPVKGFDQYTIEYFYSLSNGKPSYRFVTYVLKANKGEQVYLNVMSNILRCGNEREDRTGTGTLSLFAPQFRFDISTSLPLLTTKFVPYKTVLKELLFFLKGHTDSMVLEEQGVSIWKANTTRDFLDKRGLLDYPEGDMGPMYGYNWRHFGAEYKGCNIKPEGGFDQLSNLIHGLRTDPYSRRHMITTFDPSVVHKSVLAPCHGIVTQFYVSDKKYLSCHVYCRSSDSFLGLPFNIASYAMLTAIIAKMCDMFPLELVISTGDCHIYKNHITQVVEQLKRPSFPFPVFIVSDDVRSKTFDELTLDDFELVGYLHHPAIKAPMAV